MLLLALFAKPLIVAYVPNWVEDMAAYAETIDYAKLTHIAVAFENPTDEEGNLSYNPADGILVRKAKARGVKVLVSIAGGYVSENKEARDRYFRLIGAAKRPAFVAKIARYVRQHGFDGLDVDLEGTAINADYGPFVADLRKALKGKLLTAALSRGNGGANVPTSSLAHFDFISLMAYDNTGPWRPNEPGQHASLESAKTDVAYWLARGLPKSKTVLGVPFYGYGFGKDAMGDEWSYAKIVAAYPGAEKVDRIGNTIWYNGIPTIQAKGRHVVEQGLAGAMIWSLNSDVSGDKSLLSALHRSLNPQAAR